MKLDTSWTTKGTLLALGLGAMIAGPMAAAAKERLRSDLAPVADADAGGQVRVQIKQASDGRLELRVRKLDPNAGFEILVNGVKVGTLQTRGNGGATVRFRSRPHGHDLILGFDPHGAAISIRNAAGDDVLAGTVPAPTPSSDDAGKIICCSPDDDGTECEDRTADECTARGGTVSTATSCLPNPCEGAPTINRDVVCCIPDDSGPECEDRTADQCAAQGGIVVDATSCTGNPCAASTPPSSSTPSVTSTSSPDPSPTPTVEDNGGGNSGGSGKHGGDPGTAGGTYYGVPIGPR
ncbi:MAG: hypothetical protein HY270_11465 [Deltaproteobacteria bacterium]|nr:hypothetical protein [Deltaproteobacteria bacterium]